jgi:hypothetical protein
MSKILKYRDFLNENMDQAKSIFKKKFEDFEKLKQLLSKNLGYIGKFTQYLFEENISFEDLKKLATELDTLKKKNQTIDINKFKYEKLLDEIEIVNNKIKINNFINKLPSLQKSFIKKDNIGFDTKNIILKLVDKSNIDVFLSKISRYKSYDSLLSAMKVFSKDPKNDLDNVKELLQGLESKIIFEKNNIVVIYVKNWEDIKKLAYDTAWCIVSSESMWNTYITKGNKQIIVLNYNLDEYDVKFKIGVTLKPDGSLRASHDILDSSVQDKIKGMLQEYEVSMDEVHKLVYGAANDGKEKVYAKLSSSTTTNRWLEVIPTLSKEECINWARKFNTWTKSDSARNNVLSNFLEKIFKDDIYVTVNKIEEIFKSASYFTDRLSGKLVDPNIFKTQSHEIPKDSALKQALLDNLWNEEAFVKSTKARYFGSGIIDNNPSSLKISKELAKIICDKYNKIYNSNSIDYNVEERMGIKMSSNFEAYLVILNSLVGNSPESVGGDYQKNYQKIINNKDSEFTIYNHNDIFDLPIDLKVYRYLNLTDKEVKKVVKKDYSDLELSIYGLTNFNKLYKYESLIKHIHPFKISITIGKSSANQIIESFTRQIYKLENDYLGKVSTTQKFETPLTENSTIIKIVKVIASDKKAQRIGYKGTIDNVIFTIGG